MEYRKWFAPEHSVEYAANFVGKGTLPTSSSEMLSGAPGKLQSKPQAQLPPQPMEIRAQGRLTLKATDYRDSQTIVQVSLSLSHFAFLIEGEPQAQIVQLFPQSVSRFAVLGLLAPNNLLERFRLLPAESLPQSWMRRLLTLTQCSVPDPPPTPHRATESDTFGRYLAAYEVVESKESLVVLSKRRTRYIYTPYLRTATGGLAIQCRPVEREWRIALDAEGLVSLRIENETALVAQSAGETIAHETLKFTLSRRKRSRLSGTERRQLVQQWEDKSRVEVMPWQPF